MKRILLFTFLGLCFSIFISSAAPKDSLGVTQLRGQWLMRYKVNAGETLSKLAYRYHTSLERILELNPEAEFGIREGMELLIPSKHQVKVKPVDPLPNKPLEVYQSAKTTQAQSVDLNEDEVEEEEVAELLPNQPAPSKPEPSTSSEAVKPKSKVNESPIKQDTKVSIDDDFGAGKHYNAAADTGYADDTSMKKVLIIPFDPYKYFSDADDEIAQRSRISKAEVRQYFRSRLSTVMAPNKYETLHLMGSADSDTARDLDKMYLSIAYKYSEPIINMEKPQLPAESKAQKKSGSNVKEWIKAQSAKMQPDAPVKPRASKGLAKFEGKFFHAEIKDTNLIKYFNKKYGVDYYVFLNQFEVKTNYDNCIDRARQDYERNFIVHYSIYKKNGKIMAGNRAKIFYASNSNSILQIVNDNMQKLASTVLAELP